MAKRVAKQWFVFLLGLWLTLAMQTACWLPPPQVGSLAVSIAALWYTRRASDGYKINRAAKKFLLPYQVALPEDEVVKRKVMETISERVKNWRQKRHATIVSGRHLAGKTMAVDEALRGVRGVFHVTVNVADWTTLMYQEIGVKDGYIMFEQVLRRVRAELAKFSDNPTKFPVLLLDVPRDTTGGTDAMKLVSSIAKKYATDAVGDVPAHVLVSCSSAASALAFDAGGSSRQKNIWVGGLEVEEVEELVKLHGHSAECDSIKNIVAKCDYRAGDVVEVCDMRKERMPFADIETAFQWIAKVEVVRFESLTVGSKMLQELLKSPVGMEEVVNNTDYSPKKIAAEIRSEDAHAVLWHPIKKRYFFASEFHKEAAQLLKGSP